MTDNSPTIRLGVVKPTLTSKSLQDLQALLPGDIEMIPEYMGFAYRSLDEFREAVPTYTEKVAKLAAQGADLIHPEGAPPFMLQGFDKEAQLIKEWEDRHGVPVFTTGSTQVAAMRALGVTRFVGYTPFSGILADAFRRYFTDAGFNVLAMGKPVGDAEDVYDLTTAGIRDRIIEAFGREPEGAEALYILGSDWPMLDVLEDLEAALGVPVLHPVVVRCWYILTQLGRTQPMGGHGRLLASMPPFAI
jgi:maleate isomerase